MFLKHGAKKINEIELVAPTGFGIQACYRGASPTCRSRLGVASDNIGTVGIGTVGALGDPPRLSVVVQVAWISL